MQFSVRLSTSSIQFSSFLFIIVDNCTFTLLIDAIYDILVGGLSSCWTFTLLKARWEPDENVYSIIVT